MSWSLLALPGLLVWGIILCLPWRPWSTREYLDAETIDSDSTYSYLYPYTNPPVNPPDHPAADDTRKQDFPEITVLIPARNEAEVIGQTLASLKLQSESLNIILIDDQSSDNTANIAQQAGFKNLKIISGQTLPEGWSGKLWALEQGRKHVDTEYTLLLDADITLVPGTIARLLQKIESEQLDLVSLMAFLRMKSPWEIFLMPAFIYFFKLLYPFRLSNASSDKPLAKYVAAAAGGCILMRRNMLEQIGGFKSLKGSLIDDCTLAKRVKACGGRIWLGLTHSALSHRRYDTLKTIWDMVARTAYTQLYYSPLLLVICTLVMVTVFVFPVIGLLLPDLTAKMIALITIFTMAATYLPTLKFYNRHPAWSLTLPLIGIIYLLMTWSSALRHISGSGSSWKQRQYPS